MKAKRILSCAAGLILASGGAASAGQAQADAQSGADDALAQVEPEPEPEPEVEPEPEPEIEPEPDVEPQAVDFDALDQSVRQELQNRLTERGYYDGPIDGDIGEQTRDALSEFQREEDIEETGHLDAETAEALGLEVFVAPEDEEPMDEEPMIEPEDEEPQGLRESGSAGPRLASAEGTLVAQQAEEAEPAEEMPAEAEEHDAQTVEEVQRELEELGYYEAEIDGLHGPMTRQAIEEFQADHGLEVTGELDEETLAELDVEETEEPEEPEEPELPEEAPEFEE